jgi:DNA-binding NtrC family response regulator
VMRLSVPPLRERMEDVPYLTAAFVQEFATRFSKDIRGLTPAAEQALMDWEWPGNVRELRNIIERACLVAEGAFLTEREVVPRNPMPAHTPVAAGSGAPEANSTLAHLERDHIAQVLEACGGNKVHAARTLGLDRRSLYRRMARYGLARTPARREQTD